MNPLRRTMSIIFWQYSGSAADDFSPSLVRIVTGSFWSSSRTCPDIACMRLSAAMIDHSSTMWRW